MGVNWQNNDYYKGLKDYERETGLSVADRNRIANPYGSHTFGGLLISQILPQLLMGGAEKLGGKLEGSGDTGSATDIAASTDEKVNLNKILRKFDRAVKKSNQEDIDKYYKELKSLSDNNPTNTEYTRVLQQATLKIGNGGKQT